METPDEGCIAWLAAKNCMLSYLSFSSQNISFISSFCNLFFSVSAIDFHMPPICSPIVRPGRLAEAAPVVAKQLSDTNSRHAILFPRLFVAAEMNPIQVC
ncbi:hypothetical protein V6N13_015041 [Hibiscus sabdariffa]|uniref:Uncharacterized protein n=1 Tax=Hibiscus sabdariffa TaxID=183260 RepID=A0ABR2RXZ1_9ROSI